MTFASAHPPGSAPSIADVLTTASALLQQAGIENHATDARRLVCAALGIANIDLILRPESIAQTKGLARLDEFMERRVNREPVTRIIGARGFWSFELAVHANVLDPRPDTEVLIEACLESLGARRNEPLAILDVGAGSGAIIAALLIECPQAQGWAIDASPEAVAATSSNLAALGLEDRVTVAQQSWADPISTRFDLVVSNPPYIESAAIASLDPEVREYDPMLALDGGPDGLDAYRAIARQSATWLKKDGLLALEIGSSQAASVKALFEVTGARMIQLRTDYAGRDRAMIWTGIV